MFLIRTNIFMISNQPNFRSSNTLTIEVIDFCPRKFLSNSIFLNTMKGLRMAMKNLNEPNLIGFKMFKKAYENTRMVSFFFIFLLLLWIEKRKKNWTSIKIFAYLAENVFAIPLLCLAETKASANRNYYILFLFVR